MLLHDLVKHYANECHMSEREKYSRPRDPILPGPAVSLTLQTQAVIKH